MKHAVIGAMVLLGAAAAGSQYFQTDASEEINWGRPVHHDFRDMDTVNSVAETYGVTVDQIAEWNGKTEFEAGEKVLVWTSSGMYAGMTTSGIEEIKIKSAIHELRMQLTDKPTVRKKAKRGMNQEYIPVLVTEMTFTATEVTGSRSAASTAPVAKVTAGNADVRYERGSQAEPVRGSGDALAYLDQMRALNSKTDLGVDAIKAPGQGGYSSGRRGDATRAMFNSDRSAGSNGKAAKWEAGHTNGNVRPEAGAARGGGSRVAKTTGSGYQSYQKGVQPKRPNLSMPRAKACLKGPSMDDVKGDHGMAASAGLSEADIRVSMNRFVPKALSCVRGAGGFDGSLEVEYTVGCNGVVDRVSVVANRGVPAEVASCVRDTLKYASFPAHDMPDGYTFGYRMNIAR